jgi:predicted RNA-binding protein YlqC (UPF0109 family)
MKLETELQTEVRDALEQLVSSFCEHPKDLTVNLSQSPRRPIYTIACNVNDYGRVAGKMGAMFGALQVLVGAMLPNLQPEILLDEAACVGEKEMREPFASNPFWENSELDKLLHLTLPMIFGQAVTIAYDQVTTAITKVMIAPHNGAETSEEIDSALAVLLKAIGTKQGRILRCEVL